MLTVSGEDLVAATSILLAVCLAAASTLAVICRLIVRHGVTRKTVNDITSDVTQYQQCASGQWRSAENATEKLLETGAIQPPADDDVPKSTADDNETQTRKNAQLSKMPSTDEGDNQLISSNGEQTNWLAMQQSTGPKIQRALSCDSAISETSVSEADYIDDVTFKVGKLEFSLQFRSETSQLVVTVIQARDLECDHVTGSIDSYVRVMLVYHTVTTNSKQQTKVVRNTPSPNYSETFTYDIASTAFEPNSTSPPVLQFQVYSCDKYARHRLLGEAELRIADIELQHDIPIRLWLNFHELDQKPVERGNVMVSLNYLPTAERLIVVIVKAQSLCWPTPRPAGDCCVKVYLLQNGKRISKKKTSYKHAEMSPIFNEAMIFSLPQGRTETFQLKISVIAVVPGDCRAACIGHVTLGPNSTGTELVHWTQALTSIRKPVTMWHRLK